MSTFKDRTTTLRLPSGLKMKIRCLDVRTVARRYGFPPELEALARWAHQHPVDPRSLLAQIAGTDFMDWGLICMAVSPRVVFRDAKPGELLVSGVSKEDKKALAKFNPF